MFSASKTEKDLGTCFYEGVKKAPVRGKMLIASGLECLGAFIDKTGNEKIILVFNGSCISVFYLSFDCSHPFAH